eukprot:TRINITY_DN66179_c0_g1_i1.p1 TRINITY_DN66179_c0_g1~~TRINITY_DN66179_c0_g1_i1.p1  ORF type:complete len:380 (+),score=90.89 TRINITY_DN66179_c0_g1_i1:73-1140(+)
MLARRSRDKLVLPEEGKDESSHTPAMFSSTCPPTPEQAAALAAGLQLAGQPLPPPRFHRTDWRDGQRFSEYDDPDRTSEPWPAPDFLLRKDPLEQRQRTTVESLRLSEDAWGTSAQSFARVVHGVLDEEDCQALLRSFNDKGFTPALLNIGGGMQQLAPEVRDGHRVIVDSPELTQWLFEVMRPHIPEQLEGRRLDSLNERSRFLCYTPGQVFEAHQDGRYTRPWSHPKSGDCSLVTVQLYLHDVPSENGGATTFWPGSSFELPCQPKAGSALLFTQDLLHEGSLLKKGLKYTMRTEAMYTRRDAGEGIGSPEGGCAAAPSTGGRTGARSSPTQPSPKTPEQKQREMEDDLNALR